MGGYHHGNLFRTLLDEAAIMAAQVDPEAITLRELARRTGVSHSAPIHHFGTRQRLLTALAKEGFGDLSATLRTTPGTVTDLGAAYVTWALGHPGHYAVMWRPRLLDENDAELAGRRTETWEILERSLARLTNRHDQQRDATAAFALVHGLSEIWLSGALPPPDDAETRTRAIAQRLFPPASNVGVTHNH